jgi:hypothetical protein
MIYRGSRFLVIVSFGSTPTPSPSPVSKLSLFLRIPVCLLVVQLTDEGREEAAGVESNNKIARKLSLVICNQSILSKTVILEQG